jgi:hypothetical protein
MFSQHFYGSRPVLSYDIRLMTHLRRYCRHSSLLMNLPLARLLLPLSAALTRRSSL